MAASSAKNSNINSKSSTGNNSAQGSTLGLRYDPVSMTMVPIATATTAAASGAGATSGNHSNKYTNSGVGGNNNKHNNTLASGALGVIGDAAFDLNQGSTGSNDAASEGQDNFVAAMRNLQEAAHNINNSHPTSAADKRRMSEMSTQYTEVGVVAVVRFLFS